MIAFALKILLAHLIGDFVLQPDRWVQEKNYRKLRSPYLYIHVLLHAVILLVFLQFDRNFVAGILIIVFSHFGIDLLKIYLQNRLNPRFLFFLDQLAHVLVLGAVVFYYFPFQLDSDFLLKPSFLLLVICLVLLTVVAAVLIKICMSKWRFPEDKPEDSLADAGKYIGMLERLLVFGFIVVGQWQAVGLLIAAKSILRFSDLSRSKDRKLTEYVLIGTLLSIGLAILVALFFLMIKERMKDSGF